MNTPSEENLGRTAVKKNVSRVKLTIFRETPCFAGCPNGKETKGTAAHRLGGNLGVRWGAVRTEAGHASVFSALPDEALSGVHGACVE